MKLFLGRKAAGDCDAGQTFIDENRVADLFQSR
jgi:hypothetical protein